MKILKSVKLFKFSKHDFVDKAKGQNSNNNNKRCAWLTTVDNQITGFNNNAIGENNFVTCETNWEKNRASQIKTNFNSFNSQCVFDRDLITDQRGPTEKKPDTKNSCGKETPKKRRLLQRLLW